MCWSFNILPSGISVPFCLEHFFYSSSFSKLECLNARIIAVDVVVVAFVVDWLHFFCCLLEWHIQVQWADIDKNSPVHIISQSVLDRSRVHLFACVQLSFSRSLFLSIPPFSKHTHTHSSNWLWKKILRTSYNICCCC